MTLQGAALIGQVTPAFGQFIQFDHFSLVSVEQSPIGAAKAVKPGMQPLFSPFFLVPIPLAIVGKMLELGEQSIGIAEQIPDMIPYRAFQSRAIDQCPATRDFPRPHHGVLSGALIAVAFAPGSRPRSAEHGQAAGAAGQQTAQKVIVLLVVAERQGGVAGQLGLRMIPGFLVDQGRYGDGDPLLLRPQQPVTSAVITGFTAPRLQGRNELVAVSVGGTGVNRIGEDVVDSRGRPGTPAAARAPGSGVQPLEDLADRQALPDQPAVEHAHEFGFGLIDGKMSADAVATRQITVTVRRAHAEELTGARLLQLAAAKSLRQQCPFILGHSALDLKQKLVAGVVGDRMVEEGDGTTGPAELLEDQYLIGITSGKPVRAENSNDVDLAIAHGVSERIETRPVQAGAAEALVPQDVTVGQFVSGVPGPGPEGVKLTVNGLLTFLALG